MCINPRPKAEVWTTYSREQGKYLRFFKPKLHGLSTILDNLRISLGPNLPNKMNRCTVTNHRLKNEIPIGYKKKNKNKGIKVLPIHINVKYEFHATKKVTFLSPANDGWLHPPLPISVR